MKSLKKMLASRGSGEATDASSQPSSSKEWSRPALTPGFYGQFPSIFSFYFAGPSKDKKTHHYFLAVESNGQISPFYAISVHQGMVKHQITLHSSSSTGSAPLALAGTEKLLRSMSIIALPAPTAEPGGGTNQVERLKDQSSFKAEVRSFSVAVGPPAGANKRTESFEWRNDGATQRKAETPLERRLVRLSSSTGGGEEVVGIWIEEATPEKQSKLGTFHFQGSGATGELGPYWTLMAVMTLVRINQGAWEVSAATDSMIKAAARLAGAGIGIGIGA